MEQSIKNIPTRLIQASPLNPRKTFDEVGIRELAENITRQGLLQPITVRPIEYHDEVADGDVVSIPTKYEIVCGERRYRVVTLTGSETIPCIVREMTDDEAFDAMITENLQRKDVDPIDEAFAFAELVGLLNNLQNERRNERLDKDAPGDVEVGTLQGAERGYGIPRPAAVGRA